MSTVVVELDPRTEQALRRKASHAGLTLESLLQGIAAREAGGGDPPPPAGATFDQILAPVRQGFAESGMTEAELTDLFEEARDEVWQEKQGRKAGS